MNNIRKLLTTLIFTAAFILLPCLAILPVQAEGTDDYIDYAGSDVAFNTVDGAGFGMFTAQDGTTCKIEGENVVIHFVPKNTTVYNGIHWGKITDAELTKDLSFNEDGTFDITLPKETACGHGIPVAPIKISDPTATTSKQYYLCVPKEAYLIEEELTVDNQVGMFKIVSAVLKEDADGKFIKFSLSGSGYHDLFKGTYDEAVANGDNRDNWIRGYQNDEGKWEFILRLDEGDSYIPLVAISYSYLTKYENGQNPLARAFYPRQITFDADAKSLLVEDYKNTFDLALTNNVKMFKPSAAAMTVLGGPNSNGYQVTMDLTMGSDSFSALFIGEKDDAAKEGAEIINLGEGNVFKDIPVEHIVTPGNPDSTVTILEEPVILSFYSASKQLWYERKATISKKDKTIVFDPADADYTAVDAAIASIPEDLSIYTEESAAAVTAARDAVVEGLNYKHQDEVDAMAAAINDAVAKLKKAPVALTVDNKVGMFKIVTAVLDEDADGRFIKFSLSGSGYHDLFKGTYDEAVANGDNRDNWIRGYQNDEGKWEFILRLDEGDSYIPLVAISYSYLTKYENGQNPLARAFYPRQITFDADAKSLLVEDYKNTFDLALTNNVKMFKPSAAAMTVLGGPNSNGYQVTMDLTMGSDSFSALFIGEKDDAAKEGAEIINLGEGNVFKDIPVEHIVTPGNPDSTVTILEEPVILSFYSASKQLWYERKATISKKDKTIVFDPADADYTAVDAAIASIPEDLSIYTEESAAAVTAARDAVVEGLNYKHQDEVDAMAAAINEAVAKLFTKEDQAAVDNAKQLIEDAKKDYPTAAEKQAAVTAAQAAFNALSEDLQAMIPDAKKDLDDAQAAATSQQKVEDTAALIDAAKKDYPTAAEKQAAVDAAKKAFDNLSDEEKAKIPDAEKAINEAQAATDTQKQAEDKAKEDSKDTPKTDTPKVGDTATVGKFVFKVASAKNATLIKPVKKTNKKVTIPTSVKIKGKSFQVTAIANNAFKNNKKLTKIVVPASVTTIGKNAFKGCAAAKSITIGKKVKTIGASAFFGCKKAKNLIIKGTAIKKFGKKAFAKTGIKKLIVSNKKKKAAYKKKLIKAGMSKKAK